MSEELEGVGQEDVSVIIGANDTAVTAAFSRLNAHLESLETKKPTLVIRPLFAGFEAGAAAAREKAEAVLKKPIALPVTPTLAPGAVQSIQAQLSAHTFRINIAPVVMGGGGTGGASGMGGAAAAEARAHGFLSDPQMANAIAAMRGQIQAGDRGFQMMFREGPLGGPFRKIGDTRGLRTAAGNIERDAYIENSAMRAGVERNLYPSPGLRAAGPAAFARDRAMRSAWGAYPFRRSDELAQGDVSAGSYDANIARRNAAQRRYSAMGYLPPTTGMEAEQAADAAALRSSIAARYAFAARGQDRRTPFEASRTGAASYLPWNQADWNPQKWQAAAINDFQQQFQTRVMGGLRAFSRMLGEGYEKRIQMLQAEARRHFFAGSTLMRSFTLPAAVIGGAAIYDAAKFEGKMGHIAALTETPRASIPGLSKEIMNLSKQLPQTANELADGLYEVASAGFKGGEGLKVLKSSAMGAAAGLGDTKTVVGNITGVLSAYKMGAEGAAHATDVLTAMVNFGRGEASEYASALGKVVPTAAMLGVRFEEVAASLATMSRVGISPDTGATALNQLLMHLAAPTDQGRKAMAGMGMSAEQIAEAQANSRQFFGMTGYTPEKMRQSLKDPSQGGKGLYGTLADIFSRPGVNIDTLEKLLGNVRGLKAALATAGVQAKTYAEALKFVDNANGMTAKAFEEAAKATETQWSIALNNVRAVANELVNQFLPEISAKLKGFSEGIPAASARAKAIWQGIGPYGQMAAGGSAALLMAAGPLFHAVALSKDIRAAGLTGLGMLGRNPMAMAGATALALSQMRGQTGMIGQAADAVFDSFDNWKDPLSSALTVAQGLVFTLMTLQSLKMAPVITAGFSRVGQAGNSFATGAQALWASAQLAGGGQGFRAGMKGLWNAAMRGGAAQTAMQGGVPVTTLGATGAGWLQYGGTGITGGALGTIGGIGAGYVLAPAALTAGVLLGGAYKYETDRYASELEVHDSNLSIAQKRAAGGIEQAMSLSNNSEFSERVAALSEKFLGAKDDANELKKAMLDLNSIEVDIKGGKFHFDPTMDIVMKDWATRQRVMMEAVFSELKFKPKTSWEEFKEDVAKSDPALYGVQIRNWLDTQVSRSAKWLDRTMGGGGEESAYPDINGRPMANTAINRTRASYGMAPNSAYVPGTGKSLWEEQQERNARQPQQNPNPMQRLQASLAEQALERAFSTKIQDGADLFKWVKKLDDKQRQSLNALVSGIGRDKGLQSTLGMPLITALQTRQQELHRTAPTPGDFTPLTSQQQVNAKQEIKGYESQRDEARKLVNAYSAYSNVLDSTLTRIREFVQRSEEARMTSEMQKRAVDGVSKSYKDQAVVLAQLTDKMQHLTTVKDSVKSLVAGFQESILNAGGDVNVLNPLLKQQADILGYRTGMSKMQNQGLEIGGNLAQSAQTEMDRLNQNIQDLSARIQALTDQLRNGVATADAAANGTASPGGGYVPKYEAAMWAKVGDTVGKQCGATITHFLNASGIKGTATGFDDPRYAARPLANGQYAPGTIFRFKGGKAGYRVNHYAMVSPDGQHWLESNWAGPGERPNMITASRQIDWKRDVAAATWGGRRHIYAPQGPLAFVNVNGQQMPTVGAATAGAPELASQIDDYLKSKKSPLAGQGNAFVAAGQQHGIDPRFLVAISGIESGFGKHNFRSHNAWGWGDKGFGSWEQGIHAIAGGLQRLYTSQGLSSVHAIGAKWAPVGAKNDPHGTNGQWPGTVSKFLREMGGNPDSVITGGMVSAGIFQGSPGQHFYARTVPNHTRDAATPERADEKAIAHQGQLGTLNTNWQWMFKGPDVSAQTPFAQNRFALRRWAMSADRQYELAQWASDPENQKRFKFKASDKDLQDILAARVNAKEKTAPPIILKLISILEHAATVADRANITGATRQAFYKGQLDFNRQYGLIGRDRDPIAQLRAEFANPESPKHFYSAKQREQEEARAMRLWAGGEDYLTRQMQRESAAQARAVTAGNAYASGLRGEPFNPAEYSRVIQLEERRLAIWRELDDMLRRDPAGANRTARGRLIAATEGVAASIQSRVQGDYLATSQGYKDNAAMSRLQAGLIRGGMSPDLADVRAQAQRIYNDTLMQQLSMHQANADNFAAKKGAARGSDFSQYLIRNYMRSKEPGAREAAQTQAIRFWQQSVAGREQSEATRIYQENKSTADQLQDARRRSSLVTGGMAPELANIQVQAEAKTRQEAEERLKTLAMRGSGKWEEYAGALGQAQLAGQQTGKLLTANLEEQNVTRLASETRALERSMTTLGDSTGWAAKMLEMFDGAAGKGINPAQRLAFSLKYIKAQGAQRNYDLDMQYAKIGARNPIEELRVDQAMERERDLKNVKSGPLSTKDREAGKISQEEYDAREQARRDAMARTERNVPAMLADNLIQQSAERLIQQRQQIATYRAMTDEQKAQLIVNEAITEAERQRLTLSTKTKEVLKDQAREQVRNEKSIEQMGRMQGLMANMKSSLENAITNAMGGNGADRLQKQIALREEEYRWLQLSMDLKDRGYAQDSEEYQKAKARHDELARDAKGKSGFSQFFADLFGSWGDLARQISAQALTGAIFGMIQPSLTNILMPGGGGEEQQVGFGAQQTGFPDGWHTPMPLPGTGSAQPITVPGIAGGQFTVGGSRKAIAGGLAGLLAGSGGTLGTIGAAVSQSMASGSKGAANGTVVISNLQASIQAMNASTGTMDVNANTANVNGATGSSGGNGGFSGDQLLGMLGSQIGSRMQRA